MRRLCLAAVLAGFFSVPLISASPVLAEDADRVSETRPLAPFKSIVVDGSAEMIVEAGRPQMVTVTAEETRLAKIETAVDDKGVLTIRTKNSRLHKRRVRLSIGIPSLSSLSIEGATETSITGLNTESFALSLNGSGGVTISGSCGSARFRLREGGTLEAADFACKSVEVDIKGFGDAAVRASEKLTAKQRGVGSIDVYGSPPSYSTDKGGIGAIRFQKDGE